MVLEKILVPTDGSDYSMRAAKFAAELVKLNPKAKVTVFTVNSVPRRFVERHLYWVAADMGKQAENIMDLFAEERDHILEKTAEVFKEKGIEVHTDYSAGNPAEEICEYARKHDIDLIVMGTRGKSGWQEVVMGSVSHKVLHLSRCPVLLVK